jgi:SAM-dependent methyltransferase
MTERLESQYYAFRQFDRDNAESVLSYYPQFFTDGPVLELACGPGVFLDLLAARSIEVQGVDLDPGMIEQAQERGHDARLDDALAFLRAVPDASLGGLFAAHFLEHLPAEIAQSLYTEAVRALRPGGVFVAVTPNAACLSVLGYDFWRDPTHVRFYDPMALAFFATEAGLDVVETGGNPRNHPGAPPHVHVETFEPLGDLKGDLAQVLEQLHPPPPSPPAQQRWPVRHEREHPVDHSLDDTVQRLVHLIGVLDERFQSLQHQLSSQRTAYRQLLDQLYPSNETYVVARRPFAGADPALAGEQP